MHVALSFVLKALAVIYGHMLNAYNLSLENSTVDLILYSKKSLSNDTFSSYPLFKKKFSLHPPENGKNMSLQQFVLICIDNKEIFSKQYILAAFNLLAIFIKTKLSL